VGETPSSPEERDARAAPSPYRAGKPLAELIPPDRRREKTIALVVSSMVAGIALWTLGGWALDALARREPRALRPVDPTAGYVAGRITPGVLHGPSGTRAVPLRQLHVVHVWLQGCQDCMPAFEAMRELEDRGGLGLRVPVLNIAYGEADPTWARRYAVDGDLYFDVGGATFVKPLGIGSFTTLVVDANGTIIHRDRPDRPGYRERVRAAVGEEATEPSVPPPEPTPTPTPAPPGSGWSSSDPFADDFSTSAIERLVASHRSAVKRVCWEREPLTKRSADVTVEVRVEPSGPPSLVHATGDDAAVVKCVEGRVRTWTFPHPRSQTTVKIPFRFRRE
jgi:hypothetical protein